VSAVIRTIWLTQAIAAVALACVAACSGGGSPTSTEIVWWTPNWSQDRARVVADRFEAANPGLKVRLEVTVSDGLPTRIQTALRSGSPPDVIEAQHGWVIPYAQANLLRSLDDVVTDRGDYLPVALEYDTWDGHLWAAPYRIEAHALLYNKGMFREAGLDPEKPPTTWDELLTTAKALTRKRADGRSQYGYAITGGGEIGNTLFRTLPLIWMNGGNIISDDMKKAVVNDAPAVAAVTFYTDMLTKHAVSPPSTLQDDGNASRRLFIAESVAMYQSGQFDLKPIRAENPKIDLGVAILPHPEGKPIAAALGGWSFIVPKDAKNPDGAKKLVAFLNQSDNMGYYTDTFPARRSGMSQPRFSDPLLAPYKEMLQYGRRVPARKDWLQIVQIYFNGVQQILLRDMTPQAAMDRAAADIQALLDR
jgi:multiple sugar transport system substrate-binding protein